VRELNLQEATVDEIQEKLTSERERLSVIKQAVNTVVTEIGSLKAAKRLSEAYQKTSADRAENEEEAAQALTEQAKEIQTLKAASLDLATNIGQRLQEAREEFERGQEIQRSINIREQRDQEGPLEGQIGPDRIRAPQLSAEDFQTETVRQINSAIGVLQRRMDSVDSSSFRSQMQSAVSDLESMRKEIKLAKDEAVNLGPALQQGLANAITKVASAVGKGESIAKALLQSLGALAQQVGQLLIAFGVGGESLKAIASGNPALAIAAGASLVALGAAAQSAVGDAVGGATGGQGNQRPEIEGGGEASAQLDVPGFKSGVDNFRGGLAEVHSNEILALPPASSVVNNQNARAIKGAMSVLGQAGGPTGQARTMQGRMDGKLDIDVSEPDYFGIRAEIRRLDAKMEDLS
jgi:hypothetical protein